MSQVKMAEKKQSRALWPLMGFILLIAYGAIAWVLAPIVRDALPPALDRLLTRMPGQQGEIAVGLAIFLILVSVSALIVALFAPRRKLDVKTKDMLKERNQMVAEKAALERRQQRVARENRRNAREEARKRGSYFDE
jgi:hypothetical protein